MGCSNPYDKMFYNDVVIRKFVDGKYRKCTKGKITKYNDMFEERFQSCINEFRSLTRQMLTCKYIIVKFGKESGLNVYYHFSNIKRIAKSLTENVKMYLVIMRALREYSVESKELADAFNASIRKSRERITRLTNTFLPEYYQLCGLEKYTEYLENNGSSIKEDIDVFFKKNNESNITEMDPLEKSRYFDDISARYYENIKKVMDEKGIPYIDNAERLIEEDNKHKALCDKIKKEKREEKLYVRKGFVKDEMDNIEGIIFNAFESGRPARTKNLIISEFRIEEISSYLYSKKADSFYIVMVMSKNSRSRTVYFPRRKDDGSVVLGNPYSFASCFYSIDKKEAEKLASEVREGYITRISRIMVTSGRKEYMQDEFGNIQEKVYENKKNHEYFNNVAHNMLVILKDFTTYVYNHFESPNSRMCKKASLGNSEIKRLSLQLKDVDDEKREEEYVKLLLDYYPRCSDLCGSARLMKILLNMADKGFDPKEDLYHMIVVMYKENSYTWFRYTALNDDGSLEFVKNIKYATVFRKEDQKELSEKMENMRQEWYNKPLDTVYVAWDFVKIPYEGINDYHALKDYIKGKVKSNVREICVSDYGQPQ